MSKQPSVRSINASRLTGYMMVIVAATLFGFNGSLSRLLFNDGISPTTLVEFRMLIGGLCLVVVLSVGARKELRVRLRQWGWLIAFGLTLALVTFTYFVAISRLPIAVALVIQFTAPAWIAMGEATLRRRLPSFSVFIALILTFGGVAFLTGIWHLSLNGLDPLGLLYAVFALVTYAAYLLLGRRLGRDIPSLTTTTYGAIVAALFWLCIQPLWTVPANTWTPYHLLLIVLVGIFGMAIPFTLVIAALRVVDATRAGIVSTFELVAGGVIAYFWLGQQLDFLQVVGGVLVLSGIVILQGEGTLFFSRR